MTAPVFANSQSSQQPLGNSVPTTPSWEHFSAAQGLSGLRGYGHCPAQAFSQIALAFSSAVTDPRRIQVFDTLTIECRGSDLTTLLGEWLSALRYQIITGQMLCCAYDVSINGHHLHATAWGEEPAAHRHQLAVDLNGCEFSELSVAALQPDCWVAQCIIDKKRPR